MGIDSKYIRVERLPIPIHKYEIVDFPRYFLDLLLEDNRFSNFVLSAKLPGEKEYKDARKSSQTGMFTGLLTGIGWEKTPVGLIQFDGCSVIGTRIKLCDVRCAHMMYFTPQLGRGSFGNVIFKAETKGFFGSKKVVDIEIEGDNQKVPGLSNIRTDKDLTNKILSLFKSGLVEYDDYKDRLRRNEIRFTILRNPFRLFAGSKEEYGVIEIGFATQLKTIREKGVSYASLCKTSFEVVDKIAEHLRPMWSPRTY
jgi:hypothetical protein